MTRLTTRSTLILALLAGSTLSGCASPLGRDPYQQRFRDAIRESVARETRETRSDAQTRELTRNFEVQDLPISDDIRRELDTMAGPRSYTLSEPADLGNNLDDAPHRTVGITLEQVLRTSVRNNLQVEFARLEPAVQEAQLVQAQAAFDWVLYSNANFSSIDSPRTLSSVSGNVFAVRADVREDVDWTAGIRRNLSTGGQFAIQQQLVYSENRSPNLDQFPNPASTVTYTIQYDQPLLRNFGSDVALQQVRLARNAERDAIAKLKTQLISTITDAERNYWALVQLHHSVKIQERSLARGIEMKDKLERRFDVTPADISNAISRVDQRNADLQRLRNAVRETSDTLRVLMNDPDMPIGSDVILLPLDAPLDEPITYNYADAISTAVLHRPEIEQATLSLDNTGIRYTVARNQLLPQLDLRLQTRLNALDGSTRRAYEEAFGGNFVDYLVGLVFEMPIGNRAAEAGVRGAQLQRLQAATAYRQTVQSVVQEVRRAIYNLRTNYELVELERRARISATESLRSTLVRTEKTGSYDPPTVDLILNLQDRLAEAERSEAQALADYNSALAELHAALGLTLERNRIEFVVPDPSEQFDWPATAAKD